MTTVDAVNGLLKTIMAALKKKVEETECCRLCGKELGLHEGMYSLGLREVVCGDCFGSYLDGVVK